MSTYRATIQVWPYSGMMQTDAAERVQKIEVQADNMDQALKMINLFVKGLEATANVWQAPIYAIERVRD